MSLALPAFTKSGSRAIMLVILALTVTGCTSTPLIKARAAFWQGDYASATRHLESSEIRTRDKLLVLMEKALVQHVSGDFKASSETFLQAAELSESSDYISVSEQSAALAVNEWVTTYRGEYSERLWIHSYQMMNFLLLDEYESAAVEARRALKIYDQFPDVLEKDFFTRALIALVFEKNNLHNDALIEYRKLAETLPDKLPIANNLATSARLSAVPQLAREYSELAKTNAAEYDRLQTLDHSNSGELVLFLASGNVPFKIPGDIIVSADSRISFPVYRGDYYLNPPLSVFANDNRLDIPNVSTSLASVATDALEARAKTIAARQVVRLGIKRAIVKAVERETETGALLLGAAFFLLEEADTRSWQSLPSRLKLLRIRLPAGQHSLKITSANRLGKNDNVLELPEFSIEAGQTVYRKVRYATDRQRGYY